MSSEGIMFALMICLIMGRQMGRLDVIYALQHVDKQLDQSHTVMWDLLPDFVVEGLMSQKRNEPEIIDEVDDQGFQGSLKQENTKGSPKVVDNDSVFAQYQPTSERVAPPLGSLSSPLATRNLKKHKSRRASSLGLSLAKLDASQSQKHESVTVFFSDLVGFSTWSHSCDPDQVMQTLDDLFSRLDTIIMEEMPGLYKVETVGDAYVVAANLVVKDKTHALSTVRFALRAQYEASQVFEPGSDKPLQMRIGVHSGPVTAGIVEKLRKRYCMFGDTVNMAARTETSCPPGNVQVTEATHLLLCEQSTEEERVDLCIKDRGMVEVKGAEEPLHMFLVSRELEQALGRS